MTKVKDGFYKQVDSKIGDNKYALLAGGGHSDLSTIYTKKIQAIPFIVGNTGTSAGTWTGSCDDIDNYYNGLSVIFVPSVAGNSTTTLNINNLGAITCYYNASSKLTTHYPVGAPILLTYYNGTWRTAEYWSNSDYLTAEYYARYKVHTSGYIGRYMLVMKCPDGTITGLCKTNNSTATNKTMYTGPLLLDQVFYMNSTGSWAAGANMSSNLVLYENYSLVDIRYTFNCGSTLTAYSPFYIVLNKDTDNYYYLDTTQPWQIGVPTTNSDKIYLHIGSCYDTYRVAFEGSKKAYQVKNGKLIEYHPYADNASFADNADLLDGYHAGNASGNIPVSNGTLNTNLNADLLDNYHANQIENIYHGGWCSGTGTYYGKVAEYKYNGTGTVDLSATFLISRYATSESGTVNILNIRGRGNSKSTVTCTATWSLNTNNSIPITITHIYDSNDGYYYIRIYFKSNGWGEIYGCKLLNSHGWSISNMTSWTLYADIYSTSTNIQSFTAIPTDETVIPISTLTINNNAVTASALTSTGAYKAWGQTFFNNGIPVTHNGSITDVENITPLSNAGYSLGSSTKRWLNIYGRNLQSDTTLYLDSATSTSIILRIGGVEKARFCQPNGYLCIGVTSPSYSIHTSGTIGGNGIYANIAASGTANGLSLYSNSAPDVYGIAMRSTNTTTFAKIGRVQGDWATFFTMNDTTNRGWIFRSGTTSYASISTRGEAYFPSIGKDGYIPYPGGGKYTTTTSSITGAICIELPVSWTRTMLKFEVDIYNYSNGTSVTYVVGGYNYDSSSIWFNTTAYSLRQGLNGKGNLTVRFGHNGTHCCVYIGETNTTWEYPQVVVRNFHAGYNNYEYNRWASGWVVSFVTTLGTITSGDAGTITNPAINYNSDLLDGYHASGLFTVFSGGGISSSGNTLTQADHSITIGGTNKTAGSSTASIINSNSLTGSTAKSISTSTYNLSITSTVNGVASTKSITKLWSSYIDLQDIRGTDWAPNHDNYPQKSIVAWFNSTGTPASDWYSGITVKGWTNDYASWQLAGYSSSNTTKDDNLYFRNGINGTWKAWKTILDSNNSSVSSTANSITVKINGTTATLTNTNTDTLVNQSQTTTSNWRPVILGYQSSSKSSTALYTSVTNVVYTTNVLQYQPSTGLLSSTRLDLTQATGTAPMIIASTTKVNNLNTDLLDEYHAIGSATISSNKYIVKQAFFNIPSNSQDPQVDKYFRVATLTAGASSYNRDALFYTVDIMSNKYWLYRIRHRGSSSTDRTGQIAVINTNSVVEDLRLYYGAYNESLEVFIKQTTNGTGIKTILTKVFVEGLRDSLIGNYIQLDSTVVETPTYTNYVSGVWSINIPWSLISSKPAAAGSLTRPIYWTGSAFSQITATINGGTASRMAYYSAQDTISASANIQTNGSYIHIINDDDVGGTTADTSAPFTIGTLTSTHIAMDGNEILAKTNATTPGTLYLQDTTGTVQVNGSGGLKVWDINIATGATTDIAKRTISSNSTLYLNSASSTSIIFNKAGSEMARFDTSSNFVPSATNIRNLGSTSLLWQWTHTNKINLNRVGGATFGRIYYYNSVYYTWVDYMSNSVAGVAPTGGQPSTTTEVTAWAKRSLIENQSGYGWIWEATTNAAASSTSTKPTARMSLSSNTGRLRVEANASSTTNNTGGLIVSSVLNGGSGNIGIELWRGSNASWSICNESGTLHIRDNYTTSAQSTFLNDQVQIAYNTGTISLKTILPFSTNTYNFGSTSLRFKLAYNIEEYIGTTSGAQCHLKYDTTDDSFNFIFD